jgi:16S rRNA processing protein RimM
VTTQKPSRVTVAHIVRPHGRRGEVACQILTDFPDHLKQFRVVQLWDRKADPREARVRSCWLSRARSGQAIFHFEGSDSIHEAEKLVGLDVQIPLADRVELPSGSYYVTDLIDCEVLDCVGALLGAVADVQSTGETVAGTPILVVDSAAGELLIPLAQEICIAIDVAGRKIRVEPPEGLLDLNRNS